jgi:hypothetical protein
MNDGMRIIASLTLFMLMNKYAISTKNTAHIVKPTKTSKAYLLQTLELAIYSDSEAGR